MKRNSLDAGTTRLFVPALTSTERIRRHTRHVRFSNRPVGVKRFQAIHGSGGNVARGLVLLYGIGT
jgi:hypothetical protein